MDTPSVNFFITYFILMLSDNGRGYNYKKVLKWTKDIDIFALDYVIIPIHMNENHWCLAVINMKDKRIEYYDSMGGKNYTCVKYLQQYIVDEYKTKRDDELDISDWRVYTPGGTIPQQDNIYDCGVFMCQFAETIGSGNSIQYISQQDMPYYRKRMLLEIIHNNKNYDS